MNENAIKSLNKWIEKLQDTGKRNRLINFRDSKTSTVEVVCPSVSTVFSQCASGAAFDVFIPSVIDEEDETEELVELDNKSVHISKKLYTEKYSPEIKKDNQLLLYSTGKGRLFSIVRGIGKKAQQLLDESGVSATYMAFGFIKWREAENSEIFYYAPLLLVHANIIVESVIDPIKIEICDDDILVNPTFNYLIQNEYGIQLPEYEDGEPLMSYYSKVERIIGQLGWSVVDECKIGIFSFLKLNMMTDLKNNFDQVVNCRNIQKLLGNREPGQFEDSLDDGDPSKKAEDPLIDLHSVVDADSSQIEAIQMAKSGKSFVLQGPPGTGKSQTITNIIAECLYDQKKVLFVSEKQAALNVVFEKLKQAGLADFCLELHSHKANKKAVIEELNRTLEIPHSSVSSRADEEVYAKKVAQRKLDAYANELHIKREGINKSLYQLFELYSSVRNVQDIKYLINNIQDRDHDYFLKTVPLVDQYANYIPSIGNDYRKNPLYGLKNLKMGYEAQIRLQENEELLISAYGRMINLSHKVQESSGILITNYDKFRVVIPLLKYISETRFVSENVLSEDVFPEVITATQDMKSVSSKIIEETSNLLKDYKQSIIDEIDGEQVYSKLINDYKSPLTRAFSGAYKSIVSRFQSFMIQNSKISYSRLISDSKRLMTIKELWIRFSELEEKYGKYFNQNEYNDVNTTWDPVIAELIDINELLEAYKDYDPCSFSKVDGLVFEECKKQLSEISDEGLRLIDSVSDIIPNVQDHFIPEVMDLVKGSFANCIEKLTETHDNVHLWGNWFSFLNLLDELKECWLEEFVDAIIENNVPQSKIVDVYKKCYYKHWIQYIMSTTPKLYGFTRIEQDQNIITFKSKDVLQYKLNKAQIQAELSQKRPNLNMIAGGSAVSIIRREGQKKRRQMPIRKLLSSTCEIIQTIKPCFLMSPLSVSTFLEADKIRFDTVIFDEASQIFPQDALGAIYRGKQVIVVGDSKQMPPSNFFSASLEDDEDDENYDDITDFESILDICSSVYTTERLSWHYRSRYEQLIAFSNYNYYGNSLITFPSSTTDHEGIGVDYYYAGGIFDRKSKTNRKEAELVVDLIYKHIDNHPDRSLGIVAFSVSQQNLIDAILLKRRESKPQYEWFFSEDKKEPFFIKNLETVQGDERDTIIFSIAYAYDERGRFILNFGPLNREGGERRLNVAVTRAKENVQLVASIHFTDINLNNSKSEGVRLLRAYLDYAENGEIALERTISPSSEDHYDSYLEQEVCDFLREKGYTVDTQVGCSGYKIDLGVRRPDSSDYVMAVECDGATYHRSKNARDRDRLRQSILEGMGWTFYRIWSTDWFKNNAVEKERLVAAVEKALSWDDHADFAKRKQEKLEDKSEKIGSSYVVEKTEDKADFPLYKLADDDALYRKNNYNFQATVREIITTEAPLSEEYLLTRFVHIFDSSKVTDRVRQEYEKKMKGCENIGIIRENGYLYLKDTNRNVMRIPGDRREVKYIAIQELAAGFYRLIELNVYAPKDELYKLMTKALGYSRTGEMIQRRYYTALKYLEDRNKIKIEGDTIRLV